MLDISFAEISRCSNAWTNVPRADVKGHEDGSDRTLRCAFLLALIMRAIFRKQHESFPYEAAHAVG